MTKWNSVRVAGLASAAIFAVSWSADIFEGAVAQNLPVALREGAYTAEQAGRGEKVYAKECALCHGPMGEGGEQASPLSGTTFIANWSGLTAGDLLERMRTTMPEGSPGKLTRAENADVLAFLLKLNGFRAGTTELSKDTPTLKLIKIESPSS